MKLYPVARKAGVRRFKERWNPACPQRRKLLRLTSPEQAMRLSQPEVFVQPLVRRTAQLLKQLSDSTSAELVKTLAFLFA